MKNNTENKISKESAAEIAEHLSAVLLHPDVPEKLYNDIVERVCDMANMSPLSDARDDDKPEYLTKVLLASGGNFEAVEELYAQPTGNSSVPKTETKPLSSYALPELFSAAFNHPEMDSELRRELWQSICDSDLADIDSPEFIGALLGTKAYGGATKRKIGQSVRVSFSPAFEKAKEHLDILVDNSEYDDFFINALIRLFETIKQESGIDKDDLLLTLQEYAFAHSRGFDAAATEYISKTINLSPESDIDVEPNEPNDNELGNSESAGSTIAAPIIEIPQNLAFSENNQRL